MTTLRTRLPLAAVVLLVLLSADTALLAQPPQGRGQGAGRGGGRGQGLPPGAPQRPAPPRDASGNPIPAGTASVSGAIVVLGTGAPARRARVMLNAAEGAGSRTAMTDENGHFAFTGLAAGRYSLSASKTGHVGVTYGQTRPGRPGTPIQLADGEKFVGNLQLPRGSVVTGTVLDEYGEPTAGTQVRVMRYMSQAGRRTLQQSGAAATDDRGIYRVYGLQPGDYIVSAVPRNAGPAIDLGGLREEIVAVRERIASGIADQIAARELAARATAFQSNAQPQEEQTTGYAPVYYPGTTTAADAAPVAVGLGEERTSVDFQLQRVPMARIDGTVVNPTGQPTQSIQLTLMNAGQTVPGIGDMSARADSEGRFRIANVPPGTYRLIARATVATSGTGGGAPEAFVQLGGRGGRGAQQATAVRLWGSLDVPVDGRNLPNVIMTLQQGLSLTGRIVFDGTAQQPPADLTRLRVNLIPADPTAAGLAQGLMQPAAGIVDAAGKFTIPSVVPGLYRLSASGAGTGWSLESSTLDGQDSLDFPFEVKPGSAISGAVITFTDRQSQLSGTITNQRGQPAPEQTLILYSADERFWGAQSRRIRSTRPATNGQFTFASMPPGEYKLAALVDVEPGAWFDPAFLQQIDAASTRITIADGEKKVQNLQISSGR
jgi:uncharacterized protein (DUF2141 family)